MSKVDVIQFKHRVTKAQRLNINYLKLSVSVSQCLFWNNKTFDTASFAVYNRAINPFLSSIIDRNSPLLSFIIDKFAGYFNYGGLPELELIEEIEKRQWLSNLFNKIFFGDLITRYSIRNDLAMKVLIRKLAESVKQPSSFNRLSNIVSSTGVKVSTDTIIDYLEFMRSTWLIFSIENYASKLAEKVSNQKYYFIDNGLLNLFLIDPATSLLENLVAIS